jgi:SAM-dependent methyltransferase
MSSEKERVRDPFHFLTRLRRSIRKRKLFRRYGEDWNAKSDGFQSRRYDSYGEYLEHQKSKLKTHDFGNYDFEFRKELRERLSVLDLDWHGRTVLCLGARIGTEVKAFLDLGCFAIGIDLNPGIGNRYVVQGDFHELQFASNSVDVVYTNSIDHAFDLNRLAKEVMRILKSDGIFIVEAVQGSAQGVKPGFFESFFWKDIDDLVRMFENSDFTMTGRSAITSPWPGEAIFLKPAEKR